MDIQVIHVEEVPELGDEIVNSLLKKEDLHDGEQCQHIRIYICSSPVNKIVENDLHDSTTSLTDKDVQIDSSENVLTNTWSVSKEMNNYIECPTIMVHNPHDYHVKKQSKEKLSQDPMTQHPIKNTTSTIEKSFTSKHKCMCCGKHFNKKNDLNVHVRTHTAELKSHVEMAMQHKVNLQHHDYANNNNKIIKQKINDEMALHVCEICGKRYKQKGTLVVHLKTHSGDKPYQCSICGKAFATKGSAQTHLQTHSCEKPYQCHICKRSFITKGILKTHIQRHTGEKPYQCHLCTKAFITKANFRNHIIAHTGLKPYECDVCNKGFTSKYYLSTHSQIHSNEKLYNCDICNISFREMVRLKIHNIQTHSTNPEENSCRSISQASK